VAASFIFDIGFLRAVAVTAPPPAGPGGRSRPLRRAPVADDSDSTTIEPDPAFTPLIVIATTAPDPWPPSPSRSERGPAGLERRLGRDRAAVEPEQRARRHVRHLGQARVPSQGDLHRLHVFRPDQHHGQATRLATRSATSGGLKSTVTGRVSAAAGAAGVAAGSVETAGASATPPAGRRRRAWCGGGGGASGTGLIGIGAAAGGGPGFAPGVGPAAALPAAPGPRPPAPTRRARPRSLHLRTSCVPTFSGTRSSSVTFGARTIRA